VMQWDSEAPLSPRPQVVGGWPVGPEGQSCIGEEKGGGRRETEAQYEVEEGSRSRVRVTKDNCISNLIFA
jgi:hypothetical protein